MGLTEAESVFGGVTETALNDLLSAFFSARPRYLRYGSPAFVPSTSPMATAMPSIAFPGVPGGIEWAVELAVPTVDLFPQSSELPPELTLGDGQLSITAGFRLCVSCERQREPTVDRRTDQNDDPSSQTQQSEKRLTIGNPFRPQVRATCFSLKVLGIGRVQRLFAPDAIRIDIDDVEVVDIEPSALESVLECLILQILRAVFSEVQIPLEALRAGAFSLSVTRGPEIEDDAIKTYGSL